MQREVDSGLNLIESETMRNQFIHRQFAAKDQVGGLFL